MNNFAIRLYFEFEKVNFYTIHFDGEHNNETDKFLGTHGEDVEISWDFNVILADIQKMGAETGAVLRKFREERSGHAIPGHLYFGVKLRLYCLRLSDEIVILGNGGRKTTRKAQDGEFTKLPFKQMNTMAELLMYRLDQGTVRIEGKTLKGNLNFVK